MIREFDNNKKRYVVLTYLLFLPPPKLTIKVYFSLKKEARFFGN